MHEGFRTSSSSLHMVEDMKQLFYSIAMLLTSTSLTNADVIFSEDFETGGTSFNLNTTDEGGSVGTTGNNHWVINNSYAGGSGAFTCLGFPFVYSYSATPSQPAGISSQNGSYMHMSSLEAQGDGILNSTWLPADGICFFPTTHFAAMASGINTVGHTNVSLSFWWAFGGGTNTHGEVYYSTDGGTAWNLLTSPITQYKNQTDWTQQAITNAAFDNVADLRFGFRTVNEISLSVSDPGFSIDDIQVTGTAIPEPSSFAYILICLGAMAIRSRLRAPG